MRKCQKCNVEYKDTDKVCYRCLTPLEGVELDGPAAAKKSSAATANTAPLSKDTGMISFDDFAKAKEKPHVSASAKPFAGAAKEQPAAKPASMPTARTEPAASSGSSGKTSAPPQGEEIMIKNAFAPAPQRSGFSFPHISGTHIFIFITLVVGIGMYFWLGYITETLYDQAEDTAKAQGKVFTIAELMQDIAAKQKTINDPKKRKAYIERLKKDIAKMDLGPQQKMMVENALKAFERAASHQDEMMKRMQEEGYPGELGEYFVRSIEEATTKMKSDKKEDRSAAYQYLYVQAHNNSNAYKLLIEGIKDKDIKLAGDVVGMFANMKEVGEDVLGAAIKRAQDEPLAHNFRLKTLALLEKNPAANAKELKVFLKWANDSGHNNTALRCVDKLKMKSEFDNYWKKAEEMHNEALDAYDFEALPGDPLSDLGARYPDAAEKAEKSIFIDNLDKGVSCKLKRNAEGEKDISEITFSDGYEGKIFGIKIGDDAGKVLELHGPYNDNISYIANKYYQWEVNERKFGVTFSANSDGKVAKIVLVAK